MKKETAQPAVASFTRDLLTKESACLASEMESHTGDTFVPGGDLSPVEAAILSMNDDLKMAMAMLKEIKNQTAMLESSIKLVCYELSVISKNLK